MAANTCSTMARGGVPEIQADKYREHSVLAQPGEEPGLQQRTLAQPGHPEQDREALTGNQVVQGFYVGFAPFKKMLVLLPERGKTRPGMLGIDEGLFRFKRGWLDGVFMRAVRGFAGNHDRDVLSRQQTRHWPGRLAFFPSAICGIARAQRRRREGCRQSPRE